MITSDRVTRRLPKRTVLLGLFLLAGLSAAYGQWTSRTVTEVDGIFSDIQPALGYEAGLGTTRVEWGLPVEGSFTSALQLNGYDRFPNEDQPWFFPGQTVLPGQRFLAGTITFRNGTTLTNSTANNLTASLDVQAFGSELDHDNHPLLINDTWRIGVITTANRGVDRVEDADYAYFIDFPQLGTFRVFEGKTTSVSLFATFGSLDPAGFGEVSDPDAGVVLPLPGTVSVDIRPQTCPNPLNVRSKGRIPVAILGTAEFDVTAVDLDSVTLEGVHRAKNHPLFADVATPSPGLPSDCSDCTTERPDGFPDLVLKFDTQKIIDAFDEALTDGQCLVLSLAGKLKDGTPIQGWDSVKVIKNRPRKSRPRGC